MSNSNSTDGNKYNLTRHSTCVRTRNLQPTMFNKRRQTAHLGLGHRHV